MLRFLPPIAWTLLIAWFSGETWGAPGTQFLLPWLHALVPSATAEQLRAAHWLVRKAAHVTEYAILAALWRWSLVGRVRIGWPLALALAALTAALDEIHQTTTITRTGSAADVALDTAAAAAALGALAVGWRALDAMISALLWVTAGAGAALLVLNWSVDVPSGWLWGAVPAACLALLAWRRSAWRRSHPRP